MAARDFYARCGFAQVTLDGFPEAVRRSAQYRVARRYGAEWGVATMARR